ncbi:Aminoalkylphosphonate N-acetyltransferase [Methylobacterium crusticola]|uniref:Aminoalkylphosphonate N-acetyltransferase n=1 Tax=Methylobacterium crusticola TaxID=1697972 RepID=A0ABQ4QT07_9HYPH|nr:GNAT family N-acetyltransferase [Methylobacterium crusticola]GJD48084.1 Aminoalkylphosphonate N-acetyltransferase [Methylobacterium crusticola]
MPDLTIRPARACDLEAVVGLHADDALGGHGDAWTAQTRPAYAAAFAAIADNPHTDLFVALEAERVVGVFQLTFRQGIAGRGALKAVLEGVQVRRDRRSAGIGARMLAEAEALARRRGASGMQLASGLARTGAHRFYARHGYAHSHAGLTKPL